MESRTRAPDGRGVEKEPARHSAPASSLFPSLCIPPLRSPPSQRKVRCFHFTPRLQHVSTCRPQRHLSHLSALRPPSLLSSPVPPIPISTMSSVRAQSGEADEECNNTNVNEPSPSATSVQPSMTMHPISYPGMPMHMYPFAPGMVPTHPQIRSKRRQVKNACTNCQKACKKCDDARPCLRCVKYGIGEECVDSQRKERKKGIKRGPYKKRDGKGRAEASPDEQLEEPVQQGMPMPPGVQPGNAGPPMPYMPPVGYPPPGFYPPYPVPPSKPGESYYSPGFYFTPVPHAPPGNGQDAENVGYPPPHSQFYPAPFMSPYAQPYPPPYMMHPRPDGQMPMPGPPYGYPPMYQKPPSAGGPNMEGGSGSGMHMGSRRDDQTDGSGGRNGDGLVGPSDH
ncbi:hypothetical protein EW146_g9391 [Bondarzewia mesenterica]|uniref:Transcription activator of gluconeogenesis ERT1 n=1 Tax=Bondarzewia mesenterica TaxID=1095465 RepID=A0A4S4LC02_9AGAM|nr:hypothetical protein EW146_g9391 [Bondarzewia mesenterica]